MEAGFGMDFVVRKHVSLRPVQVDYMISQLTYHSQNQFRVSTGIVFRWRFADRRNAYQDPAPDRPAVAGDAERAE